MANKKLKLYGLRKFVWATSAAEALVKEKKVVCDDVWIDEDFRKSLLDYKEKKTL